MYQVFAMVYRHSRKVLKSTIHQIKVFTCPAYAGVSVESWQYGVLESLPESKREMSQDYGKDKRNCFI